MKFIETNAGRIYYWQSLGSPAKPTLVFLHGLSSNHTSWAGAVNLAQAAGYGTLNLDLRGHGLSDQTRRRALYTISRLAADLAAILKQEAISSFILVGYSYGAYVALELAVSRPAGLRGLILVSGNYVSPLRYHWYRWLSPLAYLFINLLAYLLIWQKRKKYHYFEAASRQTYWQSTFTGFATMPLAVNFWLLAQVFRLDYQKALPKISCPTLLIKSPADRFVTEAETKAMAKLIPEAERLNLGTGHFMTRDHEAELARSILNFAAQLT